MTKTHYSILVLAICAMLPISAIGPYLFYGKGMKVMLWVWQTGYWPFWLNFGIAICSAIFCLFLLLRFNPLGRMVYSASSVLITAISALFSMSEHRHVLLVVVFLLAAILVWTGEWLRRVLDLPFYNSRRNWWEAHPKSVPGITAKVSANESGGAPEEDARVVNFGESGCFIFLINKKWEFVPAYIKITFPGGKASSKKVI